MASLSWEPATLVALLSHDEVRTLGADNHAVLEDVATDCATSSPCIGATTVANRIIATVEDAHWLAALP